MYRLLSAVVLFSLLFSASLSAQTQTKQVCNADVIKMVKEGLPEAIIIKVIESGSPAFDISTEGVIALTKAGVSEKAVAAIFDAQKRQAAEIAAPDPSTANVKVESNVNVPKGLPAEPGVYYMSPRGFVRIEQMSPKMKSKGILKAAMNPLARSSSQYVFKGSAAPTQISESQPVFYIRIANLSPRDLMMVLLDKKGKNREVECGSYGTLRGAREGLKDEKLIEVTAERIGSDIIKAAPIHVLAAGEYALGLGGFPSYDFGVTDVVTASK